MRHLPTSELRLLAGLLRSPQPGAAYAEQVVPALPTGEVLEIPGFGSMFVRTAGVVDDSLPVVLLHGWTWNADLNFAGLYRPLAEQRRLIAPDLLGHGRSARAVGDWKIEDASNGVIALLDHLGIERAIVVGFSMGGVMAVDLANRHPERVAGIVVQAAAACYTTTRRNRMLWRLLACLRLFAGRWPLRSASTRAFVPSLRHSDSLRAHWDWTRTEFQRMTLAEILTVADEVRRRDLRSNVTGPLHCPSEVTVLTRDHLCQPPLQRELARLIGAVERDLRGDHDLPLVNPERYVEGTMEAIRRVSTRAVPVRRAS